MADECDATSTAREEHTSACPLVRACALVPACTLVSRESPDVCTSTREGRW